MEEWLDQHYQSPLSLIMASYILPFLGFVAVGRPTARLVSSKGRHLKSFLYPPHSTFRRSH